MIIRNGATREIKWEFKFPESGPAREDILKGFHGLFDANGDGRKEMIFGNRTAVTLDNSINRVDENFEIVAVHDFDEDGLPDLGEDETSGYFKKNIEKIRRSSYRCVAVVTGSKKWFSLLMGISCEN